MRKRYYPPRTVSDQEIQQIYQELKGLTPFTKEEGQTCVDRVRSHLPWNAILSCLNQKGMSIPHSSRWASQLWNAPHLNEHPLSSSESVLEVLHASERLARFIESLEERKSKQVLKQIFGSNWLPPNAWLPNPVRHALSTPHPLSIAEEEHSILVLPGWRSMTFMQHPQKYQSIMLVGEAHDSTVIGGCEGAAGKNHPILTFPDFLQNVLGRDEGKRSFNVLLEVQFNNWTLQSPGRSTLELGDMLRKTLNHFVGCQNPLLKGHDCPPNMRFFPNDTRFRYMNGPSYEMYMLEKGHSLSGMGSCTAYVKTLEDFKDFASEMLPCLYLFLNQFTPDLENPDAIQKALFQSEQWNSIEDCLVRLDHKHFPERDLWIRKNQEMLRQKLERYSLAEWPSLKKAMEQWYSQLQGFEELSPEQQEEAWPKICDTLEKSFKENRLSFEQLQCNLSRASVNAMELYTMAKLAQRFSASASLASYMTNAIVIGGDAHIARFKKWLEELSYVTVSGIAEEETHSKAQNLKCFDVNRSKLHAFWIDSPPFVPRPLLHDFEIKAENVSFWEYGNQLQKIMLWSSPKEAWDSALRQIIHIWKPSSWSSPPVDVFVPVDSRLISTTPRENMRFHTLPFVPSLFSKPVDLKDLQRLPSLLEAFHKATLSFLEDGKEENLTALLQANEALKQWLSPYKLLLHQADEFFKQESPVLRPHHPVFRQVTAWLKEEIFRWHYFMEDLREKPFSEEWSRLMQSSDHLVDLLKYNQKYSETQLGARISNTWERLYHPDGLVQSVTKVRELVQDEVIQRRSLDAIQLFIQRRSTSSPFHHSYATNIICLADPALISSLEKTLSESGYSLRKDIATKTQTRAWNVNGSRFAHFWDQED